MHVNYIRVSGTLFWIKIKVADLKRLEKHCTAQGWELKEERTATRSYWHIEGRLIHPFHSERLKSPELGYEDV
jgi:hypothetical protein